MLDDAHDIFDEDEAAATLRPMTWPPDPTRLRYDLHGPPRLLRPESFLNWPPPGAEDGGEPLPPADAVHAAVESLREPPPIEVTPMAHHFAVSMETAVEYGMIPPPPGWEGWTPPYRPLHARLAGAARGRVYRLRIALANRLAGFDVEAT